MRECVTHHQACDCREAATAQLRTAVNRALYLLDDWHCHCCDHLLGDENETCDGCSVVAALKDGMKATE